MIGDINMSMGQEAVSMLIKEFGNKVSFLKTDVTKRSEMEGNIFTIYNNM